MFSALALVLGLSVAQANPLTGAGHDHNHQDGALTPAQAYAASLAEVNELAYSQGLAEESLQGIKMWSYQDTVQVTGVWKNGQEAVTLHFMCHMHGDHFDCHKQSRPGPGGENL